MRRYTLSFMLSLAMVFSLVNVDFSNMIENPAEMVSIGPDAAEARSRGGSSRSFSRPSRPKPRVSRPAPPRAAPAKPKPAPPRAAPAKPAKPGTAVAKPAPSTRDGATRAAARTQSRVKRAGATPKATIASSSGKPIKVAGTPASKSVRGMSADRYNSRTSRRSSAYNSREGMRTPAQRTVIVNRYGGGFYGDPYGGLFMYSLLSMSMHHQSMFHYNHWGSYSAQRQASLMAENAQLRAQMATHQAGGPPNSNYAPEGTDADLMYSDEFVNAAYNAPAPAPVEKGFPIFWTLFGVSVAGFATWFFLFRRTEVETS